MATPDTPQPLPPATYLARGHVFEDFTPGRVFEDTFIQSLPAGGGYASHPANIHAYDIRTGALKWAFNVVPRIGEVGSETWPEKDRERFGGVHNWSEFTVDPETGIAFIPTGTARSD